MSALRECNTDLSIIIPVYNLENYLAPMLRSLKLQDFGGYNVEILFVLNNCTDNSEAVIRDSGLPCSIISCTEQGCGPARNAGIEATHGEYIWFMDGDDWLLSKTAVRDVLDQMIIQQLRIIRIPFASNKFGGGYFSMVWQYCIRRDLIGDIRFPSYQPSEDDAFMIRILMKAGCSPDSYWILPAMREQLYYYNYLREGSNMWRHSRGEKI